MAKSDKWIKKMAVEKKMIEPFEPEQVRKGISYGTSSYGYDFRISNEFKIMQKNTDGSFIDPKKIEEKTGIESRPTILGHLQRGGSPTLRDRTTASLMGVHAIDCLLNKKFNRIIVEKNGVITDVDIEEGLATTKTIPQIEIDNARRLS